MVNLLKQLSDRGVFMVNVVCRVDAVIFLSGYLKNGLSRCSENIFFVVLLADWFGARFRNEMDVPSKLDVSGDLHF